MSIHQHFKKLGFDHNVTAQEAKDAYKMLVKIWHPDQFSNDPVFKARAEEKLKEINVAYSKVKIFLALQDKPHSLFNTGMKKLVLTLSVCGDLFRKMSTNFFDLLHKRYAHTNSGYGPNNNLSGFDARESGYGAVRFKKNSDNEFNDFQHVLDEIIRAKTHPRGFGN